MDCPGETWFYDNTKNRTIERFLVLKLHRCMKEKTKRRGASLSSTCEGKRTLFWSRDAYIIISERIAREYCNLHRRRWKELSPGWGQTVEERRAKHWNRWSMQIRCLGAFQIFRSGRVSRKWRGSPLRLSISRPARARRSCSSENTDNPNVAMPMQIPAYPSRSCCSPLCIGSDHFGVIFSTDIQPRLRWDLVKNWCELTAFEFFSKVSVGGSICSKRKEMRKR